MTQEEALNTHLAERGMVARDIPKVVNRIDAMHKNQRAKELINKVVLGREYSKQEFDEFTSKWLEEVRKDYPEIKHTCNTIKVLNEFCSSLDRGWSVKRRGTGVGKRRTYTLYSLTRPIL